MNTLDPHRGRRRGVLLLLVLSALTMFMMLGALMLVLATRTRTAARAFSTASTTVSRDDGRGRAALDEALMRLLRGGPTGAIIWNSGTCESILADLYGTSFQQMVTATSANSVTLGSLPPEERPNGRVLTLVPRGAGDPGQIVSYRIVSNSGNTLLHDNRRTVAPFRQPPSLPMIAYVNGRDFGGQSDSDFASNEPWDKPGDKNRFLTESQLSDSGIVVTKPACGLAGPCEVDNDGDGVADGVWLSGTGVLPPQPYESGTVSFRVSYAVFDLDGRVNVNAHGLPPSPPDDHLGPASVDVADVMGNHVWVRLLNGGTLAAASTASGQQRRLGPALGSNYIVDGRTGRMGNAPSPYDVRLDFDGPRPGTTRLEGERVTTGTIGSLFTPGELERVLRPFDADAAALAPRLAGILGDDGERGRVLLTTDSWDTTALTGSAASVIMNATATTGLPQQVIAGRRFNINSGTVETDAGKQAFFDQLLSVVLAAGAPSSGTTAQWVANVVDFRDEDSEATLFNIGTNYADMPGTVIGFDPAEYMDIGGHEDCDEFVSIGQLLCVPRGSAQQLSDPNLNENQKKVLRKSLAVSHPVILDAVTVESLFKATVAANPWREPGRVNVNTCEEDVWKAVLGGGAPTNPYSPAQSSGGILNNDVCFKVNTDPSRMDNRDYTLVNAERANRLANIATTRSNVFAVWITVESTDSAVPDQKAYRRLFAIVDRSIPVGYCPGVNLNARDTLRLVRYLE
jgi:hypothetical protein